jgi:5'-deoxynucleotidase YfbR-like HD superfamily hydrolase
MFIKKDIQKHLKKMGRIKVYKKPNFSHEKTQEEYNSDLGKIADDINAIKEILSKKMNMVRLRILDICVKNLTNAFNQYYNTFTYSRDRSQEKKFTKAIDELNSFVRAARLDEEINKETEGKIKWLYSEFTKQASYIQQVEKQIRDNNIEPFTEIVESLT